MRFGGSSGRACKSLARESPKPNRRFSTWSGVAGIIYRGPQPVEQRLRDTSNLSQHGAPGVQRRSHALDEDKRAVARRGALHQEPHRQVFST